METKYLRGKHPNSQQNLGGAEPLYESAKKKRSLWVTDLAWEQLDHLAQAHNLSRAELIERLGRGLLRLESDVA
jgi:hypothetical protein